MPIGPENESLKYYYHHPRTGEISLTAAVIGVGLTILNMAAAGGCTVRVPNTEFNATVGAALGHKDYTRAALPHYVSERLAKSELYLGTTIDWNIGPLEGILHGSAGPQPGTPDLNLHLDLKPR